MVGIGQVQHTKTGYQPIDCVAYGQVPVTMTRVAAPRDIVLYRIVDFGPSRVTSADRPADDNELLVLTRGSGQPAYGCLAGHRYTVAPNRELRASFVPGGADSQNEFASSAKSVNLIFPVGLRRSLVEERGGGTSVPLLVSDNAALIGLISLIEFEPFRPGLASDVIAAQAMRSLALILSGIAPNGLIAESDRISLRPVRLRRVIDFIEANLAEPLTFDLLAHVVGLSVFHFAQVFRHATGYTPYRYVSERWLLRAQRLLMNSQQPIGEIGAACGFPRHANFSAAFACARHVAERLSRLLRALGRQARAFPFGPGSC